MTTLVTGGAGVIGATVVRLLLAVGQEPVVLDTRADRSLLGPEAAKVPLEVGDVNDLERLVEIMARYRISRVAHLGAIMPESAQVDPYAGFRTNTGGTLTILEAARRSHVERVVFTSSKAALGPQTAPYIHPHYLPVPRTQVPQPDDVYGSSKLCSEVLGRQFALETGLSFIVLRLASTYGPGKTVRHGKVGILSRIVEGAVRGEPVIIPRGGDQQNDFLYCKDIAQAVIRGLDSNLRGPHLFQIGSGRLASIQDFVRAVCDEVSDCHVRIGPGLDYSGMGVGHYFRFDIEPAQAELGFEPQYDVVSGVRDYVQWLREHQRSG